MWCRPGFDVPCLSSFKSVTTVIPVRKESFMVETITPTGPRLTHPLQYKPEGKWRIMNDKIVIYNNQIID